MKPQEQLQVANDRKQELWARLLDMEGKYLDCVEQVEVLRNWVEFIASGDFDGDPVLRDQAQSVLTTLERD